MSEFEKKFNSLNEIEIKAINAYRSGREFKNISLNPIVYANSKFAPVIIASIVNKSLACELFLKS